jgi:hypothetical protein
MTTLKRYERAFKCILGEMLHLGVDWEEATLPNWASCVIKLSKRSLSQAKNAYSALMLFPSLNMLRFEVSLSKLKKAWNQSEPAYVTFFDATEVLHRISLQNLDRKSIPLVRDRLIIVWRILGLYRSFDLSGLYRTVSQLGDEKFVVVHKKGWLSPRWERVLSFPDSPDISPWHLLLLYCSLTVHMVPPPKGVRRVLLSLVKPFDAISADRIGSLTGRILSEFGVDTGIWKPHSTRGAGVAMYSGWGIPPEVVAQLGSWKNLEAFCKHYLRLGNLGKIESSVKEFLGRGAQDPSDLCVVTDPPQSHQSCAVSDEGRRGGEGTEHKEDGSHPPTLEDQETSFSGVESFDYSARSDFDSDFRNTYRQAFSKRKVSPLPVQKHFSKQGRFLKNKFGYPA